MYVENLNIVVQSWTMLYLIILTLFLSALSYFLFLFSLSLACFFLLCVNLSYIQILWQISDLIVSQLKLSNQADN